MFKKKHYESPFAEIEKFTIIDVVTGSADYGDEETDPFAGDGNNALPPGGGGPVEF